MDDAKESDVAVLKQYPPFGHAIQHTAWIALLKKHPPKEECVSFAQYSSGSRTVVPERSASVMIQNFTPLAE